MRLDNMLRCCPIINVSLIFRELDLWKVVIDRKSSITIKDCPLY